MLVVYWEMKIIIKKKIKVKVYLIEEKFMFVFLEFNKVRFLIFFLCLYNILNYEIRKKIIFLLFRI